MAERSVRERLAQPAAADRVAASAAPAGGYGDAFMERVRRPSQIEEVDFRTPERVRDGKAPDLHAHSPLSREGESALRTVRQWQASNPADTLNTGNQLLRSNGKAERAIATFLKNTCQPAFEPLLEATLEGASREILSEAAKRGSGRFEGLLALGKEERQQILLKHITAHLLGRPGSVSPMQQVMPLQARAFLRELCGQVERWVRDSTASGIDVAGTVSHVLPATLVLRGLAPWACNGAPSGRASPIDSLRPDLGALLMSLAVTEPQHTAVATGAAAKLRAAKAELRARFHEELAALVDFPVPHPSGNDTNAPSGGSPARKS